VTQKLAGTKLDSWLIAIMLMAALPSIFVILTWDLDGVLSPGAYALRYFSIPITLGQILVVFLALRKNFSIFDILPNLHLALKTLLSIWFVFASVTVLFVADNKFLSAFATLQYALHGVFLAALIYLAKRSDLNHRDSLLEIFSLGAVAYIALLALFIIFIPDKESFPWVLRLPSGTNVRQIGYFSAILAIAPISLLLFGKTKSAMWCVIVSMIVMFISWTGSRGALVGLFIAPLIASLTIWRALPLRRAALLMISFVVGMGASLPLPAPAPDFGLVRMASSLSQEDLGSGRNYVWKTTITEIAKSPWIGHGSGTFRPTMKSLYGYGFNQPHQFMLQYVYDWGLLGGGAACLLLLMLFVTSLSRARKFNDASAFAGVSVLCIIAAIGSIDGALYYPMSIVLAATVVAFGFVNIGMSPETDQRGTS
jgi:O-antigen ligase